MVQTVWSFRQKDSEKKVPEISRLRGALELLPSYSPLFITLLGRRSLHDPEIIDRFLRPSRLGLYDPFLMKGMRQAVDRIEWARQKNERIMIHGDYDVDGITGTAIVSYALERLGIAHENFLPERKRDGYGVNLEAIQRAAGEGIRVLITVDCGISAREPIRWASETGVDVIVLDHHQIPAEGLPPAFAILNPLQEDCGYPFKELSAGGLAFKLAQALLGPAAFECLDLAALSTIADVAPLKDENRILVSEGLDQLSQRKRTGIRSLIQAAALKAKEIKTSHVGFILAPRINASGRMSSASTALRLLLTANEKEADSLAQILEQENRRRQQEERKMVEQAIREVERTVNFAKERIIVVAKEGWHAGVIGIVAARLAERYHRPSFVIALLEGKGRGSARSIRSFHLCKALENAREHLTEFGGHAQAAGFNITAEQVDGFRQKINKHSHSAYSPENFLKAIDIDLEILLEDLTSGFLREIEMLEPHGVGNPKPVFLTKGLTVRDKLQQKRGNQTATRIWVTDGKLTYEVSAAERSRIAFTFDPGSRFDLVYTLTRKFWDGEERIILEAKDAKPCREPA